MKKRKDYFENDISIKMIIVHENWHKLWEKCVNENISSGSVSNCTVTEKIISKMEELLGTGGVGAIESPDGLYIIRKKLKL